jgi:hypothetical protein
MEQIRAHCPPASLTTIIYHSPCNDGFGAAFIAWRFNT